MDKHDRPLFGGIREELAGLAAEARETIRLRWELARLELAADADNLRRLAIGAAIAGVIALVSLPLLVAAIAQGLDHWTGISSAWWLAIFGLILLAASARIGFLAWRRFRREFVGLAETLEELREDLVWLKEWDGKNVAASSAGRAR